MTFALTAAMGCAGILSLDEFEEKSGGAAGSDAGGLLEDGSAGEASPDAGSCSVLIAPDTHDFGEVLVGETSAPFEFSVFNPQDEPLGPLDVFGGESPNPSFRITSQTCHGETLDAAGQCAISFVFEPTAATLETAPLFIRVGGLSCATALLRGKGRSSPPPDAGDPPDSGGPADAGTPPTAAVQVNPPLVSDTEIGLSWSAVARATEYGVLWSNANEGSGVTVQETWMILQTNTSIEHWFTIYACNSAGCGPPAYVGPVKKP